MSFRPDIVGCFSEGAADNPTAPMINAGFAEEDLNWVYVNCEVKPEGLGAAVAGARAMGWAGFHCSIPHKVTVINHLDRLSRSARLIGAVNTAVSVGGELVGENTDGLGFVASLDGVLSLEDASVVVLGAGGAARAVAVESALAGAADVTVISRRLGPAESLSETISIQTEAVGRAVAWQEDPPLGGADLVVNATPVGMAPNASAIPDVDLRQLQNAAVVADLVPNPALTRFLARGAELGHTVVDGTGMLVNQAIESVRLWSGEELDREVMRASLEVALARPG